MRPLTVMHVLFRFAIGGLENGMVNLINGLDPARYRHVIVCLDDFDAEFARRIHRDDVELLALHKRPGNDPRVWWRIWRLLRRVRPDILHTRNFAALELQVLGALSRVPRRVHGEHGWDVHDLDGSNRKHRRVRRALAPLVHRFIALSRDLARYLRDDAGVGADRIVQIYNGVDSEVFAPAGRRPRQEVVIGTVGRMKTVKNQPLLVRAFCDLLARRPDLVGRTRLLLVGDGPLRAECEALADASGRRDQVTFAGDSSRVADELRALDIFVLPSLAEGISNTILEAMASGLPVVATAVGGNPELVDDGQTGALVPSDDAAALAAAIERYVDDDDLRSTHGACGRASVLARFSLPAMVAAYDEVYRSAAVSGRG